LPRNTGNAALRRRRRFAPLVVLVQRKRSLCYGGGIAMVGSTFVENYETEQPILELARFMNMAQQKAAGQDTDMSDSSELYQVRAVAVCARARVPPTSGVGGGASAGPQLGA